MSRWTQCALIALALAFVAAGMLFVPRLGIEADEAIITNGIYDHGNPWYSWKFAGAELPIMLISYLGALKAWFYNGLFLFVPPRPMILRLPMLLLAGVTLWLFFELLDRTVNRRAAWIGTLLLATDTSYLLLNTADYGPVTLQFVFKLAALVLLVRFHKNGSRQELAYAFFFFGLGLWDKAVFAWVLFGLAVAAVAVFPRDVRKHLSRANIAVAGLALLAGALPLVIYNVDRPLETLRSNAHLEQAPVLAKTVLLERTMDGAAMFGFLTAVEPGPHPGEPNHWYQSLSLEVSRWTGHPHRNAMLVVAIASGLSLIFLWKSPARQPILFGLIACLATWLPMVLTAGAGAAAQHVILLWPFHLIPVAAVLALIPSRGVPAIFTALLCGWNLAVTNQYYADLIVNGPAIRWTDAMDPLNRYLTDLRAPRIVAADWGFIETMNLLGEGELPMYYLPHAGTGGDQATEESIAALLRDPSSVFVAHAAGFAFHPGERAALEDLARREHYEEQPLTTIQDRNGRPTFDVFRFRKLPL
jgi:Dolichyl-phosphate-mannose-protein mannosyltransferase